MNGRLGMTARGAAACLATMSTFAVLLMTAAPTSAHRSFPVPSCKWTPTSLIDRTYHLRVRELRPVWVNQIAPVLACGWVERKPKLEQQGLPIVIVQFRELQRFPVKGFTYVPHLGTCFNSRPATCPVPSKAAWVRTVPALGFGQYAEPFAAGIVLRVEDGLNMIEIETINQNGPLPVRNPVAATEVLARKLLRHFYWN
jgi:hypothetical protein